MAKKVIFTNTKPEVLDVFSTIKMTEKKLAFLKSEKDEGIKTLVEGVAETIEEVDSIAKARKILCKMDYTEEEGKALRGLLEAECILTKKYNADAKPHKETLANAYKSLVPETLYNAYEKSVDFSANTYNHNTLVLAFTKWLESMGYECPSENAVNKAIDTLINRSSGVKKDGKNRTYIDFATTLVNSLITLLTDVKSVVTIDTDTCEAKNVYTA